MQHKFINRCCTLCFNQKKKKKLKFKLFQLAQLMSSIFLSFSSSFAFWAGQIDQLSTQKIKHRKLTLQRYIAKEKIFKKDVPRFQGMALHTVDPSSFKFILYLYYCYLSMHAQCILSPCICKFSKKDSLKSKKLNVESELITSKLFILGIQNQRKRERDTDSR